MSIVITLLVITYLVYQTYKGYNVGFSKRIINLIFAGVVFMIAIMLQNPIGNMIYKQAVGEAGISAALSIRNELILQGCRFAAFFVLLFVGKQLSKIVKGWLPERQAQVGFTKVLDSTAGALVSFVAAYFFMYVVLSIVNALGVAQLSSAISSSPFLSFIVNSTPGLSTGVFKTLFSVSRTTA